MHIFDKFMHQLVHFTICWIKVIQPHKLMYDGCNLLFKINSHISLCSMNIFLQYLSSMRLSISITITITIMIFFLPYAHDNTFSEIFWSMSYAHRMEPEAALELKIFMWCWIQHNGWSHHGSPSITEWKEGKLGQVSPMSYIPGELSK